MTKRAVLYARVSGDDRGNDGRNLAGKLELAREYAMSKGYRTSRAGILSTVALQS